MVTSGVKPGRWSFINKIDMKKAQAIFVALSLMLLSSVPLAGQHFVPVYESLFQPMNIIVDEAIIGTADLEAGDEIGIFDTNTSGDTICVGAIVLSGPVVPGTPLPIVASTDDPLTTDQDGFIDNNPIIYRFWDDSEGLELTCVFPDYVPGFDEVFISLGTALTSLEGIMAPTANAGPDDETCEDTPYTLAGSASFQGSVLWETSGDGTFDDATLLTATYTPGTSDIASGIVLLTLNAYAVAPCGEEDSDDMELLIAPAPTADAGTDDEICENSSYTLNGSAGNYESINWTTSGDGSFDDTGILSPTYTPGSGDISNGSVTLTLTSTAILPCSNDAIDNMVLSIQMLPGSDAGPDASICENGSYTLSGNASNYSSTLWSSSGDGSFDDATLLDATYTPGFNDINNGSATLTLTAEAISPCGSDAADDMALTFQELPIANAGPNASICENVSHTLAGTATDQSSVEWTTAGDGTFDDPSLLNATYTPGAGDISNGSVLLSLTAYAIAPCNTTMTDAMTLSFTYLPDTPATPTGPTEVDTRINTTSVYEVIPPTPGAITYHWNVHPEEAGNINNGGITAVVSWNVAYHGYAYIKVYAWNSCGTSVSDSLEVFVYNTVGMDDNILHEPVVTVMPNPSSGNFRVNIDGAENNMNITLFSSDGSLVKSNTLGFGNNLIEYDMSGYPKGMYFMRIYDDRTNILKKVILQ
jgi:hypothetical protein